MSIYRKQALHSLNITEWARREVSVEKTNSMSETTEPVSIIQTIDWPLLQQTVAGCTLCPLHHRRLNTVFGTGNIQADLMIIGEAPGAHEDQQGLPFVGRAGQLLTKMLASVGFKRDQVFIGNVLKCRPPKNRDPSPEEVATCTPYLEQQIAYIKPKCLLAVGRIAAHYLLGLEKPLGQLRGQQWQFGQLKTPLYITYHPAYLLRNPRDKRKAYIDLCRTAEFIANYPQTYSHSDKIIDQ